VVYVGLDYATAFVQAFVLDRSGRVLSNRRVDNDWHALARHVAGFGPRVEAALEACTGAADLADELIQRAGWSVSLAHPGYVNRMKQTPDKSDFTDAQMLADLVRVGYLPRVWLAPQALRELRRLTRHRQDLVDRRRAVKLRVSALLREHRLTTEGKSWTQRWRLWLKQCLLPAQTRWVIDDCCVELEGLTQRIARVELRLQELTQDDAMVQKLCALRGIGRVTACVLRAEIGNATRFRTGKQLSRFCGLTPRNASSGERQADAGLIAAGNRQLRSTRIEAAHRLMRYDPRWQAFAGQLEARGKKRCVVVAAVANRWVRGLYHDLTQLSRAA
jgi:transposase